MSKSRIIISDPHGCYKTLLALIAQLPKDVPITFAGDLIDRGPDSRSIVEFVKEGGYDCVVGNHEVMMMNELKINKDTTGAEFVAVDYYSGIWIMNGGDKALLSYGGDVKTIKKHLKWLKTLPYFIEYKDVKDAKGNHLLVTHTTAADVWGEEETDSNAFKNAVTWDRVDFPRKIKGIYNVYGHTPQQNKATIKEHFACIDTGAYFKRSDYGRLTALQFPEMIVYEQKNVE